MAQTNKKEKRDRFVCQCGKPVLRNVASYLAHMSGKRHNAYERNA